MKHFLLFTLSLLFFWQTGFSQIPQAFYVSGTGDDGNPGTEAAPWRTISFAISQVSDEDTIKVSPGIYDEDQIITVDKSIILEGIGAGGAVQIDDPVSVGADSVFIKKITLNGLPSGLVVGGTGNNTTVQNSIISAPVQINSGASGFVLTESDLSNASASIQNNSGNTVDASYNWWGSQEQSDIISKFNLDVTYSPWLNKGDDTSLEVGFQPDLSSVSVDGSGEGDLQNAADALNPSDTIRLASDEVTYSSLIANKSLVLTTASGQPQIDTLGISGSNVNTDTLTVEGNLLVSDSIILSNGNIKTGLNSEITLGDDVQSTDEGNGRLVGNFVTTPRNIVPQRSINILGSIIQGSNRANALSNLVIRRVSGDAGIVTENESESIKSNWTINADEAPTGRNITFYWPPSFDNGITAPINQASVIVWRQADDSEVWEPVTDSLVVNVISPIRFVTVPANAVDGFSSWTVSDIAEPLPVTLVDFTARLDESSVRLDWATATETNAHFFGIERSTDGLFFEEVARTQAVGESNSLRNYLYIDEGIANRLTGTLYYRLRMVDFDETFEYSHIVAVSLSGDDDLRVYADASTGTLKLFTQQLPAGDYLVQVSDMLGNVLIESSLTTSDENPIFTFPLSSPARSVYVVRCFGAQALYTQKFRLE